MKENIGKMFFRAQLTPKSEWESNEIVKKKQN